MHLAGWRRRLRQKRRGDMLVGEKWRREQGYCKSSPRPHHLQYWRNKTLFLAIDDPSPSTTCTYYSFGSRRYYEQTLAARRGRSSLARLRRRCWLTTKWEIGSDYKIRFFSSKKATIGNCNWQKQKQKQSSKALQNCDNVTQAASHKSGRALCCTCTIDIPTNVSNLYLLKVRNLLNL